jgi:hypothetical protein
MISPEFFTRLRNDCLSLHIKYSVKPFLSTTILRVTFCYRFTPPLAQRASRTGGSAFSVTDVSAARPLAFRATLAGGVAFSVCLVMLYYVLHNVKKNVQAFEK